MGERQKLYHFHLSIHESIHAWSEEQAREKLSSMYPHDVDDFELTDVEDPNV